MTSLADHGPVLTPIEAATLHDRPEPVPWFVLPAPRGKGVIARAHMVGEDQRFDMRLLPVKSAELRPTPHTGPPDQALIAVAG